MVSKKADKYDQKYDNSYYLISRLFNNYIKSQAKYIVLAILCLFLMAMGTALNAWLIKPMLDGVFIERASEMLLFIPIALFISSLIKAIASFYQKYIMKIVGQEVIVLLEIDLYKKLLYADATLFFKYSTGKLISRFTNDMTVVKKSISSVGASLIAETTTVMGLLVVMFYQNAELALVSIIVFPLTIILITQFGKRIRSISRKMQKSLSNFTIFLDETFKNIGLIKK